MQATHEYASVAPDIRSRLEEGVKAAGLQTRVLSSAAERALVGKAVDGGLHVEYAQNIISAIALEKGYVREVEIARVLLVILKSFAKSGEGGKVDRAHFDTAVAIAKDLAHDGMPVPALMAMAKHLMLDQGIPVQSGGFLHADWFKEIQAEASSPWQQYKNENNLY
jgi:hypothetical protein